ncbi:FHA domain-containing protein [Calothrix sp. NIES-2100]|uniref:FHA domain-containing protein n=1 Tax=Calothrix sp. NIES-2100 TaxID=1954172 RepID=UPI000B5E9105|nr:FHA domain-containing protein [Calothrix sp. NIES-2100]
MPANRCPNPNCEYFNRALPNNAKVCPWCSTPLGNVITPTPTRPASPPPIPPQPTPQQQTPPPPIPPQPTPPPPVNPPNYQPPVDYSTEYQQRVPPYVAPVQPAYTPPPPRIPVLKLIHTTGREFTWCGEAGFIGRRSQSMTIPPEIDLTGLPNEGIISRRHARIFWDWSQNAYMIIDMSTNGIYLNNTPLNPGVQYRLLNGDLLQFGQDNLVRFNAYIV